MHDDRLGYLCLQLKDIVDHSIERVSPDMGVIRNAYELRRNSDATAAGSAFRPPHSSFQNVLHAQIGTDPLEILACLIVLNSRSSRDHAECRNECKPTGQFLGHA